MLGTEANNAKTPIYTSAGTHHSVCFQSSHIISDAILVERPFIIAEVDLMPEAPFWILVSG